MQLWFHGGVPQLLSYSSGGTFNKCLINCLRRVALRPQTKSVKPEDFQNKTGKRKVFYKKNRKSRISSASSEDLEGLIEYPTIITIRYNNL